jgi:two-component system chemotaxis response regulator CheY
MDTDRWVCHLPLATRVLVADDDKLSALVAATSLREAGYRTDVVHDGLAALERLESESYDLLVTDWVMPRLTGLELCRVLRERRHLDGLYVLFLTSMDRPADAVQALSSGADDYVNKPFEPSELVARVQAGTRILEHMALSDPMTGLPNRRALERMIGLASEQRRTAGTVSSLALIDVDRFKSVNDAHGHLVGDEVLGEVARRLQAMARAGDATARLGGDEFAVMLYDCHGAAAAAACERLRAATSEHGVMTSAGEVEVSISIGVCEIDGIAAIDDVLRAADRAMYEAKRGGRDRVAHHPQAA